MTPAGGRADESIVRGPRLVEEVSPGLATAFGSLWLAVTRAGGAVGHAPDAPEGDVRAAAERTVRAVATGREQMLVLESGDALVGAVLLVPGDSAFVAHRGQVLMLMVHPDLQGRGWGGALLDAVAARATELGLEQLLLSARGGTTLPAYYAARGWTEVGVWSGAIKLDDDDRRDEHWFQLRLG